MIRDAIAEARRRLDSPVVAGIAVASVAALSYVIARGLSGWGSGHQALPSGVTPPRASAAPFAQIPGSLTFPVVTNNPRGGEVAYVDTSGTTHGNAARRFGASRGDRKHVGIDLYANEGDPVLAISDGTVVATQSFHLGSDAILVEHDGAVVLYGEVAANSWKEFGLQTGSRVQRGQPIARVACMVRSSGKCTSQMLHVETYRPGTRRNAKWFGSSPPPEMLDPTLLLLTAR